MESLTQDIGGGRKLKIERQHDDHGFQVYVIEDLLSKKKFFIQRFILDEFRSQMRKKISEVTTSTDFDFYITFKEKNKYRIQVYENDDKQLIIKNCDNRYSKDQFLIIARANFARFVDFLYHVKVGHTNDILNRIVAYHRLFQFTFQDGSNNMNSSLAIRKHVLSQYVDYIPRMNLSLRKDIVQFPNALQKSKQIMDPIEIDAKDQKSFRSRLSERDDEQEYKIDYQSIFSKPRGSYQQAPSQKSSQTSADKKFCYPLPLHAHEIRNSKDGIFKVTYDAESIHEMRSNFLGDRESDYFLGFEMVEGVFRQSQDNLKSFRFPLYYMCVDLIESGKELIIKAKDESRIYLNHLALVEFIEAFTLESNPEYAVDTFFKTLLVQVMTLEDQTTTRIYLSRMLPFKTEIFDKARTILFGDGFENGRGGILQNLNTVGIECDLESCFLYKSAKNIMLQTLGLEYDLKTIQNIAETKPKKFFGSILGQFLSPEQSNTKKSTPFVEENPLVPGWLPKSTRSLLGKLSQHDLVLLEGPPGTGKTHTIMNLFIHAVCSGKRILVVSDQKSAIEALTEKLTTFVSPGKQHELYLAGVKTVAEVPTGSALAAWTQILTDQLRLDSKTILHSYDEPQTGDRLKQIDSEIQKNKKKIKETLYFRLNPLVAKYTRVTPKRLHETTDQDIDSLVTFLRFLGDSSRTKSRNLVKAFIKDRETLGVLKDPKIYDLFQFDKFDSLEEIKTRITKILKFRPRTRREFSAIVSSESIDPICKYLRKDFEAYFEGGRYQWIRTLKLLFSYLRYPLNKKILIFYSKIKTQNDIAASIKSLPEGIKQQLTSMHQALHPKSEERITLSLEVCKFFLDSGFRFGPRKNPLQPIQFYLNEIDKLQKQRDEVVKQTFIQNLMAVVNDAQKSEYEGQADKITQIKSMLDSLKNYTSFDQAKPTLDDVREKLASVYPFWICRKQIVSLLFPCVEKLFDLVIIDEATQCKVDDALPLMFRAKRIMVVGDDKQTVLSKNSFVDDYLFSEFNLAEHLRSTQAQGIKGGGNHIFGLVKSIRQASVMLDEHYRCPPDIIAYSNHYVYQDQLNVMQWLDQKALPCVYVDYSEKSKSVDGREDSGQFKGIDTGMLDRFLEYVANEIKKIEKETGHRLNVETDVALCYFLLKNESYVKHVKQEWLRKLDRGADILDGAGAALQGKERDYIFYYWDIYPGNMMAFKQGDDPDKRKGELNVLMSRPKKRAYHFLHKDFENLDHQKTSISDFLWKQYQKSLSSQKKIQEKAQSSGFITRAIKPSDEFIPWRRYSGPIIWPLLRQKVPTLPQTESPSYSVVVGNPRQKIDCVIDTKFLNLKVAKSKEESRIGIVDLSGFDPSDDCHDEVIDYFFQIKRAQPKIDPFFTFIHEIADSSSYTMRLIKKRLGSNEDGS